MKPYRGSWIVGDPRSTIIKTGGRKQLGITGASSAPHRGKGNPTKKRGGPDNPVMRNRAFGFGKVTILAFVALNTGYSDEGAPFHEYPYHVGQIIMPFALEMVVLGDGQAIRFRKLRANVATSVTEQRGGYSSHSRSRSSIWLQRASAPCTGYSIIRLIGDQAQR